MANDTDDVQISDHAYTDKTDHTLDDVSNEATAADIDDEASMMGSAPDPESDDDTLQASHLAGLRQDETPDDPKELNTAADVAAAEKARRSPPLDRIDDKDRG